MIRNAAVHKFTLNPPLNAAEMISEVQMPSNAQILDIGAQRDACVIWALVDPKEEHRVTRRFQVVPTGVPFENKASSNYIGRFQIGDGLMGLLVFHVFEVL